MNGWTTRGPNTPSRWRKASEDKRLDHSRTGYAFLAGRVKMNGYGEFLAAHRVRMNAWTARGSDTPSGPAADSE